MQLRRFYQGSAYSFLGFFGSTWNKSRASEGEFEVLQLAVHMLYVLVGGLFRHIARGLLELETSSYQIGCPMWKSCGSSSGLTLFSFYRLQSQQKYHPSFSLLNPLYATAQELVYQVNLSTLRRTGRIVPTF
jgi:hypothetical protein